MTEELEGLKKAAESAFQRFLLTGKAVDNDVYNEYCKQIFEINNSLAREDVDEGIDCTLSERESQYGDFGGHAKITQSIKRAMVDSRNWNVLTDDKKECLEMVAHKIGRILNGDTEFHDSWHDCIGYLTLVEKTLTKPE